jgi:hypothetical protein
VISRVTRTLLASPLANALALDAAALLSLATLESIPAVRGALADDLTGRVPGLALVGVAWFTLRLSLLIALGHRRAIAFAAGMITLVVGVLHGSGSELRTLLELRLGAWACAPVRELLAAAVAALAALHAWRTSPAVRG